MFTLNKKSFLFLLLFSSLVTIVYSEPKISALTVDLSTDKSIYRTGEPVKITLFVDNKSPKDANLLFGSGQSYDIMITDKKGIDVWHWSRGKVFSMAVRNVKIAARQNLKYTITWKQIDNNSRLVTPGKYFVRGRLMSALQLDSPPRTIIIK